MKFLAILSLGLGFSLSVSTARAYNSQVVDSKPVRMFAEEPTFSKEIVRLFQQRCQNCHRPGGLAPFPLIKYEDTDKRLATIDREVQSGEMPPWKPVAGCGEFRDDRRMTAAEVDLVHRWVMAGAPEGNRADLPAELVFSTDWTLGTPDLDLSSDKPFVMSADSDDEYRCFVLPYVAAKGEFITGLEIRPDKASIVHHGIVYLDGDGKSPGLVKPGDKQPGYECFGGAGFDGAEIIGGWAPGSVPAFLPDGIGTEIPKGARFVLQIHYHKDGKLESDQTRLGIHFAKKSGLTPLILGAVYDVKNLKIPAGESNYTITVDETLDADVRLVNVFPHMHKLGRKIGLTAIFPDKHEQCLVQINNWDFSWQGYYTFKDFVKLPKGTILRMTGTYDDSATNPNQFYKPPREILWGERTVDEMFLTFFSFVQD